MSKFKADRSEFLSLVDEMERIVERRVKAAGVLSDVDQARMHEVEHKLTLLISAGQVPDERRKAIRITCRMAVLVRVGAAEHPGTMVDIGSGGVFLTTDFRSDRGNEVELFIPPSSDATVGGLALKAVVAWSAEPTSQRQGLGLAFTNKDAASDERISRLLIALLRQQIPSI